MNSRLIETDFPIRAVSEASVREKNIRHGHISTLHVWWSRKPLAASRATTLAALLPGPPDDPRQRNELLELVRQIAPWEIVNGHDLGGQHILDRARQLIRDAYGGRAPRVLDPFAGGGSIPLEALRLGCETYALDYNPVAVLLNKAILEYPQKFGRPGSVKHFSLPSTTKGMSNEEQKSLGIGATDFENPLLEAVRAWGQWVLEQVCQEIAHYYPADTDGSIPVGYYWMRTLPCQNPDCGAEIPLTANCWLAKKDKKKVAIRLVGRTRPNRVDAEIVEGSAINFDPEEGTVARAYVKCPCCGGTIDDDTTRQLFRKGKAGQRMMAVVLHHPQRRGKTYRLATDADLQAYRAAEAALEQKCQRLREAWGIDPVPDEPLPPLETLGFRVQRYGLTRWGDLFNPRQKLALITFADAVRLAHAEMLRTGYEPDFAKAVTTYLGLRLDLLATYLNTLVRWQSDNISFLRSFDRQALPMVWDYGEVNPQCRALGKWEHEVLGDVLSNIMAQSSQKVAIATHGSATSLPWPDGYFDAVVTDPPYYDNVPYADLSDFFYVWLKRTVRELYPDLFATPLTPKTEEMVADASKAGSMDAAKCRFEKMLTQAFREIHRVLRSDGIAVIVFAHKTTEAWETVINALLEAGLYMTASWPIHTEKQSRLRAQESAALASSIYMVCRKRTSAEVGEYRRVREEIQERVRKKLSQFWDEGIRGADFFMSAIGPAVEAFGRYVRVEKQSGDVISVAELLEYVRKVVANFALERILQQPEFEGVDALTQFYLLWRWVYNHAPVPFDEARKLASGVGVELTKHWGAGGLVKKESGYVRVLSPHERAKDKRFEAKEEFETMVDALHWACILWEQNRQKDLAEHLAAACSGTEVFWRVAQGVSEVLPEGDKEKKVLQGLLYGRKNFVPDLQGRLFEEQ